MAPKKSKNIMINAYAPQQPKGSIKKKRAGNDRGKGKVCCGAPEGDSNGCLIV